LIFSLRCFRIELAERGSDFLFAIVAQHGQRHLTAGRVAGNLVTKCIGVIDCRFVYRGDDVSLANSGPLGSTALPH
jgi:hypothetical protein